MEPGDAIRLTGPSRGPKGIASSVAGRVALLQDESITFFVCSKLKLVRNAVVSNMVLLVPIEASYEPIKMMRKLYRLFRDCALNELTDKPVYTLLMTS